MHILFAICFGVSAQASMWGDWSARPAWPEPISFAAGAAATATSLALRHPLVDDFQKYESTVKPLGPGSKYGDLAGQMIPNALYAGGMWIAYRTGRMESLPRAELMVMASLESSMITEVLKLTVREERPDSNHHTSFPSGHSTTAFAFASVVGLEHGWWWGTPAYLLGLFVAWSRINDNRHFLHDTLAGATIGISTGLGIYLAREKRREGVAQWRILPMPLSDGGAGLSVLALF